MKIWIVFGVFGLCVFNEIVPTYNLMCNICDNRLCFDMHCAENITFKLGNPVGNLSSVEYECFTARGTNKTTGEEMEIRSCTTKESHICEVLKRNGYDTCSTCETYLCNSFDCYTCDSFYSNEAPTLKLFGCQKNREKYYSHPCQFPFSVCYSAKQELVEIFNGELLLEYSKLIQDRGCIRKSKINDLVQTFKKFGFSYYFCQESNCNKDPPEVRTPNILRDNTKRQEQSLEEFPDTMDSGSFSCVVCENEFGTERCPLMTCQDVLKDKSPQKYNCLSAKRSKDGKTSRYKTCIHEGSNRCDELRKKGFDCTTCDTNGCNTLTCYFCKDEYNDIPFLLGECKDLTKFKCNVDEPSECFSVTATLNGKEVYHKNCIQDYLVGDLTDLLKEYGSSSYYFCDTPLCNKENKAMVRSTSEKVSPSSLMLFVFTMYIYRFI